MRWISWKTILIEEFKWTNFQRLYCTFYIIDSLCLYSTGKSERLGPEVRLHTGHICQALLWWERAGWENNRLWEVSQHEPLCFRNALHTYWEETWRCWRAVQKTNNSYEWVQQLYQICRWDIPEWGFMWERTHYSRNPCQRL